MTATQQLVPAGVWGSDGLHSSVRFEVQHMGVSMFSAGFADVDASLISGPRGLELRGRVGVASLDVHDDGLRPHVMAPDFLDVERHPELTFSSTEISANGSGVSVTGELTIKGTTRGSKRSAASPGRSWTPTAMTGSPWRSRRSSTAPRSGWTMKSASRTARPHSVTRSSSRSS